MKNFIFVIRMFSLQYRKQSFVAVISNHISIYNSAGKKNIFIRGINFIKKNLDEYINKNIATKIQKRIDIEGVERSPLTPQYVQQQNWFWKLRVAFFKINSR